MTIFRVVAMFVALFVFGLGERAQAGALMEGGRCPRLCVDYTDGCNHCSCGRGRFDVCTHYYCSWRRRARCLRHGF